MNTKKLLFSLFLLLFLLINIVNAKEDFTASSSRSVELCPCSNQAYSVNVQNTGSVQNSYTVLASGGAAEWITFNPSKFVLNPGQKGSFFVIVNSVCNIEGDYDIEIFITTNNGLTKVVKQVLEFSQCYDYTLDQGKVVEEVKESLSFLQYDGSYSLCKNEQKSIPILIVNNENFENGYKLFLDAPEWTGLNVNSISLGAKKSGIFLINFDTTDVEGEYNFKLNAISELGKVQRKKNIEVNVQDCYALELDLKEEDIVCGGEDKDYEVIVKNLGALEQNIKLELDAPEWVNVENASIYLGSEQEKTLTLNANPEDDISGNFFVTVNAIIEDKPELEFSDRIKLDVTSKFECYKANINTKTSVTNFYSQDFFSAKVKNNGIKKAAYDVSLEGPSWISASPETLELNPGQTGNLNLIVNPGTDVNQETYGIKINLESNGAVYSKDVDIVLRKESEFVKKLKTTLKKYRYYIYLLILIIILIIILRKPIMRIKNKVKKDYEKYKVKTERLRALKLARKEREEEKKKKKELEEKKKRELEEKRKEQEKTRKKELERKKEKRIKKKDIFKKLPIGKVLIYVALLIASIIFIGHENKLFNAKYLHIYIRNLFYGYLYYILIGVGVVIVLFLLVLLYNYISKKGKKKVKREAKKAEKKAKKGKEWYNKPSYVIAIFIPIMILLAALAYLNLFDDIKDFVILYSYYFGLGIVILVIIILLIRFYKPLFKFLRE
ncbi:MAG: hypothetical protein IH934_01885 [Nanoarchaeota archaeon]|nr:hypothetical protein [Nanoarchaeota archaeon]